MKTRAWSTLLCGGVLLAATAGAQVPAGPDIMLSEGFGTLRGTRPAGAVLPNGDSLVFWNSHGQDGQNVDDVFGRRLDSRGAFRGGEFRVNTFTTGVQRQAGARPAVDARGGFVIAWYGETAASAYHVFAQRFAPDGTRLGSQFQADQTAFTGASQARVAAAPDGRFVIAWYQAAGPDASYGGVLARRYDASGAAVGAEFLVNTYTTSFQSAPDVAVRGDGSFVVVWDSYTQDGDGDGIFLQRYDPNGARVGAETRLNAFTTGSQFQPSLSMAGDGSFVVAWASGAQDGDGYAIMARRFDASAVPAGAEFRVNTYTTGDAEQPSVAVDERGDFVVVWLEPGAVSTVRVSGRRFDASGAVRGAEFTVVDNLILGSGAPHVASDRVGNFIASYFFDFSTSVDSPHARRYQGLVPTALAVDAAGNGVLEPGEAVDVAPTWRNVNGTTQAFDGTAPAFTGPAGAAYTLLDAGAVYGTVADGAGATCSDCYRVGVSAPTTRPAAHWDATLEERLTPDVQGQDKLWSVHVGDSFTDVPRSSGTYRFVETLLHRGVTGGCAPALYCPAASTTREQMAVFLLAAKEGAGYAPAACGTPVFADVPAGSPFCRWIEELARRGVTGGCGGGNYCPAQAVTREQMAVFVLRTLDPALTPPACGTPMFTDVPASSPFCRWIEEMARRGITGGCGGGNYCPSQAVTREQMAVFLTTAFALSLYGA